MIKLMINNTQVIEAKEKENNNRFHVIFCRIIYYRQEFIK